jgi:hypothetical protein
MREYVLAQELHLGCQVTVVYLRRIDNIYASLLRKCFSQKKPTFFPLLDKVELRQSWTHFFSNSKTFALV